ncbi:ankyrin repeat-containing domain protein [Mycena capillaripes]|nr:ankyrin repeat-containing domain protein [Mycena capillaripes]
MFSARRIRLHELADAISFDFSDPSRFRYEPMIRQDMSSEILQWLDGLVILKSEWDGKDIVIAHASVQDYVLSTQFSNQFARSRNFTDHVSNAFIAQSCICYLLHFADPVHALNAETFPNYPLSLYAAEFWVHHLQRSDSQEALFDLMMLLFEEGSGQYAALIHLHDSTQDWGIRSPDWTRPIAPPLALCSNMGYTDGVRYLLENGADPDTMGAQWDTPLQTAACEGFLEIVRLLLGKGANLYPPNTRWISPLTMACQERHTEIVQILLEHGALVNAPDKEVSQVFWETEDTEILQMLLKNGAITDDDPRHELPEAVKDGALEFVRCLLLNNFSFGQGDSRPGSAETFRDGVLEIFHHLRDHIPKDQLGGIIGKVLCAISSLRESQHETNNWRAAIIGLFLDNGLDVDGLGKALHVAARNANHEFAGLLLDRGADVNIQEGEFGSALQEAAGFEDPRWDQSVALWDRARRIQTVQVLVDRGANIDADGGEYGTALQLAAQRGRAEIVEILLAKGASVDADSGKFGTALRLALD